MRWVARVVITLKEGVLDPQGKAVRAGLCALGFTEVSEVRVGKCIDLLLEADDAERAAERLGGMCERLLANPVIEAWEIAALEPAPAAVGAP